MATDTPATRGGSEQTRRIKERIGRFNDGARPQGEWLLPVSEGLELSRRLDVLESRQAGGETKAVVAQCAPVAGASDSDRGRVERRDDPRGNVSEVGGASPSHGAFSSPAPADAGGVGDEYLPPFVTGGETSPPRYVRLDVASIDLRDRSWRMALRLAHQRAADAEKTYHELIMAVGNKYEGETRHQTALRYIRNAESGSNDAKSNTAASWGGGG